MKQLNGLRKVTFSLAMAAATLVISPSFATTQYGLSCPQKYIATVTNIEDVESGTFPKVEVNFQIIQTLKGDQITSKKIQIVKGGPVQFKSGEIYTVESRENWLCSATLFSKI
jgi:hypothetical protein